MSSPEQPPPSPPKQNNSTLTTTASANEDEISKTTDNTIATSATAGTNEVSKKKSRLQWDEENLMLNAAEMERTGPRMKIDEPKTPYNASSASENGSSTSGSAHQSPPESPSFIPRERLVGFNALEQHIEPPPSTCTTTVPATANGTDDDGGGGGGSSGRASGGNMSDGASSVGSGARSVHISDDNIGASAGSSPRTKELFAMRRRAHYRNEARVAEWIKLNEMEDGDDGTVATTINHRNSGDDNDVSEQVECNGNGIKNENANEDENEK